MNKFNIGDIVRVDNVIGSYGLTYREHCEVTGYSEGHVQVNGLHFGHKESRFSLVERVSNKKAETVENNAVSPNVYKFPKAEVRDISAHLTSFGGQAVQYVARSTRLDGLVKGNPAQDIEKAIQVLQWELERLQA